MADIRFVLNFTAPSRQGQVAKLTALLERYQSHIEAFSVHEDRLDNCAYVRCVFRLIDSTQSDRLNTDVRELALHESGSACVWNLNAPVPVLLLVSKTDHCLRTLLSAAKLGDLNMRVVGVVSNHNDLRAIVEAENIPYHYLPVTPESRLAQEAQIEEVFLNSGAQFMVLARYMQILSNEFCQRLNARAINIHHSFLPGFKGARPYEQAFARGVKLIGATAHFVTPDLDEGPIIEQAVERVDHGFTPEQLLSTGRHIESVVLERALRYVLERRVFINGERTVILR